MENKKQCCKNCDKLFFHDTYICSDEHIEEIDDIETDVCPNYEERCGRFWLYKDSPF